MSSLKADRAGAQTYWRSLDQLADTPGFRTFVEREFPSIAEDIDVPASRRTFLKVMGASMALAGMTACRWPTEKILPFGNRDADRVPGEPDRYATACEIAGVGTGLLVTSYDGRPVKIEGNPLHPASRGATDSWSQTAVLDLYDPDRSRRVIDRAAGDATQRTWDEFRAIAVPVVDAFRANGGDGLVVLAEAISSPTVARLRAKFEARFPNAVWLEYEPVSRDRALEGARLAFGRPVRTHLALEDAATIVSFDDDFLMHHPAAVANARGWAASRSLDGGVSRAYAVESVHSVTGSNADRRLPVRPSEVGFLVGLLARKLFVDRGLPVPPGAGGDLLATLRNFEGAGEHDAFVEAMADDLAASRGRSVVTVGPSLSPAIHALAHWINAGLDNVGATVRYTEDPAGDRPTHDEAIRRFVADADAGKVSLAVVLGCNPVAFAPADLDVGAALGNAGLAVHLGLYDDETAAACSWHLPRAHFLESWNDVEAYDGTRSVGQPLIAPLWDGKTPAELLALLLDDPEQGSHDLVRETWSNAISGPFESGWRRALHDGVLDGSAWSAIEPAPRAGAWVADAGMHAGAAGHGPDLEIVFRPDYRVYDGRFANNAWLQELPDPISKIAWDNAALIGPATAARLGLGQNDLVRLRVGEHTLELPTHLQPGQPDGTVAVTLGYGRAAAGAVGDGVGFDTYRLRASGTPWNAECTAEPTGGTYPLATTQDHFAMDAMGAGEIQRRVPVLVRELDVAELGDHPEAGGIAHAVEHEGPHLPPDPDLQLWKGFDYDDHKWGMAIDLNACTGCGACTVACQAENNIPVVGKDEVLRGREMHWIRIDRYFVGDAEAPRTVHQPVTCQHCENAPCESVCPVAATIHDAEGLNVMVYNRCIGTRYCSNNCPYKVRRFNWFNNHKETRDGTGVETMVFNPEVTVRARGVMEKCTFCVQRIQAVKIAAKNDRRPIRDGEIATACEQACPTRAITFGNLNDAESRIARRHADPRAYTMLEELNVRPRTRYLARLANRGEGAGDGHGTEGHHES